MLPFCELHVHKCHEAKKFSHLFLHMSLPLVYLLIQHNALTLQPASLQLKEVSIEHQLY